MKWSWLLCFYWGKLINRDYFISLFQSLGKMGKKYSEVEILVALKLKKPDVYRYLFDEYFEKMVLFAEYFLLDRIEAEDVVQETFVGIWNQKDLPEFNVSLKSYLFKQVKNRCLNRIKHLHVEDKYKQWLLEAQMYADIPEVELDEELIKRVYNVIDELPAQARTIFRLCVLEGRKYKEVALELGISVNTVNTQMKRAYKHLRQRLGITFLLFLMFV